MTRLFIALTAIAFPAFAQTTTTVQTQQQPPPPPSTTVTTQTNPPPPSTQVVVNPNEPTAAAPAPAVTTYETTATGRSTAAIIATDALYGGLAGALVGGAVTLIDQGNNWQRDLMVGAGIGILGGVAFGIYDATTQPKTVTRAVSDRNNAASDAAGTQLVALGGRF